MRPTAFVSASVTSPSISTHLGYSAPPAQRSHGAASHEHDAVDGKKIPPMPMGDTALIRGIVSCKASISLDSEALITLWRSCRRYA